MKISEMEVHHDQYLAFESRIRAMVGSRKFPEVFSVCLESFPNIVPAIQYRKQRGMEPETPDLLAFSTICRYAPPLFEHVVMQMLVGYVKSTRLLAKHENDYLGKIEAALNREEIARSLWNHIEKQKSTLEHDIHTELGVIREDTVQIVEVWEELGVIVRQAEDRRCSTLVAAFHQDGVIGRQPEDRGYRLCLRSQFDVEAEGVCPACGVRGKGRKELFLKRTSCKKCGAEGYYHITYADF